MPIFGEQIIFIGSQFIISQEFELPRAKPPKSPLIVN